MSREWGLISPFILSKSIGVVSTDKSLPYASNMFSSSEGHGCLFLVRQFLELKLVCCMNHLRELKAEALALCREGVLLAPMTAPMHSAAARLQG